MEPLAITLEQTAELLNVSRATAFRLPERGLPVVKLGPRLTRVPVDGLRQWLIEAAAPTPPSAARCAEPAQPIV